MNFFEGIISNIVDIFSKRKYKRKIFFISFTEFVRGYEYIVDIDIIEQTIVIYSDILGAVAYFDREFIPNSYSPGDGQFLEIYFEYDKNGTLNCSLTPCFYGFADKRFTKKAYDEICFVLFSLIAFLNKRKRLPSGTECFISIDYDTGRFKVFDIYDPYETMFQKLTPKNINYKIANELYFNKKKTEDDAVLFITVFPTINIDKLGAFLLAYGKSEETIDEVVCLLDVDYNIIYSFLDDCFAKHGIPSKLYINHPTYYHKMTPTLMAVGIDTRCERYHLKASYCLRDLILFVESYFAKIDKYDFTKINTYLTKALALINKFIADGYDITTQRIADGVEEYYDIVENDEENDSDSLVS